MTTGPDTDDIWHAVTLANGYMHARNYRRAEEVVRSALVHNPHSARLLTELARAQHFRGDDKAAERSVVAALTATPDDAYPMRIYAAVLVGLGRKHEATEWARRAVDTAPLDQSMHYEYARVLSTAGRAADALPVATEALRMAPDSADAHNLMGVVLGMLGRRAQAMAEYKKALELEPGHARALSNIAVNRANRRNLSGALAGFSEAGRLDPHMGDEMRKHITATVRRWLGWTTIAAWVVLYILLKIEERGGLSSYQARGVALAGAAVMLVMVGWLARSLPRHLWSPIMRQRGFRSLKIYLGAGALVIGVLGALVFGAPINFWVLAGTLFMVMIVSWIAPRLDKD